MFSMHAALLLLLLCQEPRREDVIAKIDKDKVAEAIKRGVEYLYVCADKFMLVRDVNAGLQRDHDLVLLTIVHADADPNASHFKDILNKVLQWKLERTYCVALQAMALEKLDPALYQWRIAQCAQFLVDNQCANGQWTYGHEVAVGHYRPPAKPPSPKPGTRALDRIVVRRLVKAANPAGDNSNSQYAAMGLRAAHEASVSAPGETLKSALSWWQKSQGRDGGWGYERGGEESYGSMTAGGMASMASLLSMSGCDPRTDRRCQLARTWLGDRFTVRYNPGPADRRNAHIYYYLYGLERAGTLFGSELMGDHEWYTHGARHLLAEQKTDGSWGDVYQTCFAILFLRRSTDRFRPPVASGDPKK